MKHTPRKTAGPSQRQLRAGELIRHALVEIFQREDFREPALAGVSLTVSEVRASPDLKHAHVYATPLGRTGDDAETAAVIDALNRIAPAIRRMLGARVDLKYTPALHFRIDESFAEAQKIDALLARPEVKRDLAEE